MDLSFPVSDQALAIFKEKLNEGIQHSKENTGSLQNANIESTLIKLVGSHINVSESSPTLKDLTSFISANVSATEFGRMALTDALWLWGTQVHSPLMQYHEE